MLKNKMNSRRKPDSIKNCLTRYRTRSEDPLYVFYAHNQVYSVKGMRSFRIYVLVEGEVLRHLSHKL
jgi:hypothetical protein